MFEKPTYGAALATQKRFASSNPSLEYLAKISPRQVMPDGVRVEQSTKHGVAMEIAVAQDQGEFGKAWHHMKSWTDDTDT